MSAIVLYQKKDQQAVEDTGENFKCERGTMVVPLINAHPNPAEEKMIFKLCYNSNCSKDNKKLQQKRLIVQSKNDNRFFSSKNHHHFWVRMKSTLLLEKKRILSWITTTIRPLRWGEKTQS
jgi:hypothetical protein